MALKRWIPINIISNVQAGSTAILAPDVGSIRYHEILIAAKMTNAGGATEANIAAKIPNVRVKLNSKVQREFTPQQLFDINRMRGRSPTVASGTTTPGMLSILFSEPQRKSIREREATCWGMSGVKNFTIELDLDATITGPAINAWALVDDVTEPPGGIVKWKRETIQVAATGSLPYKLDTTSGDFYQAAHFIEGTAGDIDALDVKWDSLQVYNDDENVFVEMKNQSDYTRVAKYRSVHFDQNSLTDALPTRKKGPNGQILDCSILATLTMAAAANVTLIREMVGLPD